MEQAINIGRNLMTILIHELPIPNDDTRVDLMWAEVLLYRGGLEGS